MLSISKPQTNLIYLSILVGRLDLTRFSIEGLAPSVAIYIHRATSPNVLLTFVFFIGSDYK